MDRLRVNILYEKLYYYENKAQPYPNGMHEYCRETFTELMNHYRKNRMLTHLNNSVVQLYLIEDIWKFEEFKNKDTIYFPEILWSYPFFTKDVSMDLDIVNFDAEKDLDENLIYVYPIVLKGLDSLDVVNLLKRNGKDVRIEKYFNVLDTISEKVISLINKGRCKVILDLEHEGLWSPEKYNRWFEEECMTEEILDKFDFTNFYFLCGDFGCEDKISNKVKINNIPSKFYVDQLSRDVVDLKNEGGHKNELGVFTEVHTMDDIDLSKKTKHFFTMLRNVSKPHRVCLAAYFEYHDLWDKNVISWLKGEWKGLVGRDLEVLDEKYHPMIDKLSDKPIFELDTQNIENKYSFSPMFTWNWEYFQETFLSIVTETTTDYITLTEKTVAPLWNLHPFIHISAPFTLEKLHGLNFKTFHPFIDESYDNETDDAKRMNMIFNELDKFRKKSVEELREWWKEISPILEYNQNNFFNISKEKSTKVNLLESFYETK